MARKAAIRHPDFTIVFRKDRNGFEGWHSGKAEAFRKTVEKVNLFFQKKYGQTGALLVDVLPSGSIVREYKLPTEAKAPAKVKAPKAPAKVKPAPVAEDGFGLAPDEYEVEDRLDASDLAVLL